MAFGLVFTTICLVLILSTCAFFEKPLYQELVCYGWRDRFL